jgi:hypothetical protein
LNKYLDWRLGRRADLFYIEGMQIYIFASETHTAVSALTCDPTGGNLPVDYAPWRPVNNGRALSTGSASKSVIEDINRFGFFLLSGKSNARHP